eukprot:3114657-Alexandrium_andersonii.AAC.1
MRLLAVIAARLTAARRNRHDWSHHHDPVRLPLAFGEQPYDTHAAVHSGPLPIVHGCLLQTSDFYWGCA